MLKVVVWLYEMAKRSCSHGAEVSKLSYNHSFCGLGRVVLFDNTVPVAFLEYGLWEKIEAKSWDW